MNISRKKAGRFPSIDGTHPYEMGRIQERDAWYTAFFIENHLDYFTHPDHAAPPEQVRFMVFTEDDERYYPCSDRMFAAIINRESSRFLQNRYRAALNKVLQLIGGQIEDTVERQYLEALIRIKFRHETRDHVMIPSRLEKRLLRILINRTQIVDPYMQAKAASNRRMQQLLSSQTFLKALYRMDAATLRRAPGSLPAISRYCLQVEITRLINLMGAPELWSNPGNAAASTSSLNRIFARPLKGDGVQPLFDFLGLTPPSDGSSRNLHRRILWLADQAGEILLDMAVARALTRLGHKVVVAVKQGPFDEMVCFEDLARDEILAAAFGDAQLLDAAGLTKNEIVKTLRGEQDIVVISDGTSEPLNLLLTSTTFARIFKEVDAIISRGTDQRRRLFDTHFEFTRDIFNISAIPRGKVSIAFKPRHPQAVKFAHADLEVKARAIIGQMAEAKNKGMTVIFYSGIIGSIPGKIRIAKKIMRVFVSHLQEQFADTFIINPSEYFEPGMDADDLMYMWEIVQTSGLIDIWRFQTYEDIAQTFRLMDTKVPPEWVGKDATFSTGCTKEMHIAQEVQRVHPEMQIIGPSIEKFSRRAEYGVGLMYDKRLHGPALEG